MIGSVYDFRGEVKLSMAGLQHLVTAVANSCVEMSSIPTIDIISCIDIDIDHFYR